jgi:hypothetical protein
MSNLGTAVAPLYFLCLGIVENLRPMDYTDWMSLAWEISDFEDLYVGFIHQSEMLQNPKSECHSRAQKVLNFGAFQIADFWDWGAQLVV